MRHAFVAVRLPRRGGARKELVDCCTLDDVPFEIHFCHFGLRVVPSEGQPSAGKDIIRVRCFNLGRLNVADAVVNMDYGHDATEVRNATIIGIFTALQNGMPAASGERPFAEM